MKQIIVIKSLLDDEVRYRNDKYDFNFSEGHIEVYNIDDHVHCIERFEPGDYYLYIESDQHKIGVDHHQAWSLQRMYKGQPHGWIQWKGTDVCMDVHCKCGLHSHIDADFAYYIKCPRCNRVYLNNSHVELIEIEKLDGISEQQIRIGSYDKEDFNEKRKDI